MIFKSLIIIFTLLTFNLFAHESETNLDGCHSLTENSEYHCHDNDLGYIDFDNIKLSDKEIINEGTYETGFSGVVYKNARCDDHWKIDIINRNINHVYIKVGFYTLDKDGDPLLSIFFPIKGEWFKVKQTSRRTFDLIGFNCSIAFKDINSSFKVF